MGGWAACVIGLVSTIILQGIFSGGIVEAASDLTISAFCHTVRAWSAQFSAQ